MSYCLHDTSGGIFFIAKPQQYSLKEVPYSAKAALKMELLRLGMTQVGLARELDITPGRLNAYINGYCHMPPEIWRRIKQILAEKEE